MARNGGTPVQMLEVTVLSGVRLKDTNSITKQNPFVKLEYGSKVHCTITSRGGGVNPSFQDKFQFELIEGLKKLKVSVYNKRTLGKTILIGAGKVKLEKVLDSVFQRGSVEDTCLLFNNRESAGEIRLLFTCPNINMSYHHEASSSTNQQYYAARATPNHHRHPYY